MLRGSLTDLVDPRDERLIHRLEAFSDIVIGFSMALLALDLPTNAADVATLTPWLAAFLISFGFVALLWWLHNRLFAYYFTATPLAVGLNFAALAGIALFIFATTAVAHKMLPAGPQSEMIPFFALWMGLYGAVLVLLGLLYAFGLRERWSELAYPIKHWGVARALNSGVGGLTLLAFALTIVRVAPGNFIYILPLALTAVVSEKLLTPRIVGKAPA